MKNLFKNFLRKKDNYDSDLEVVSNDSPVEISSYIICLMEQYIRSNINLVGSYINFDEEYKLSKAYSDLVNLGLENTKNARIIKSKLDKILLDISNRNKAKELIDFVKYLQEKFDSSVILISSEQFTNICSKYKFKYGLLSDYTGIIPDRNIQEIKKVKDSLHNLEMDNVINKVGPLFEENNRYLWYIKEVTIGSSTFNHILDLERWLNSKNNFVFSNVNQNRYDGCLWLSDIIEGNSDIPEVIKEFPYGTLVKFFGELVNYDTLFIACPSDQLKHQSIKITKNLIDPIVFQYSPYGIIIHSIWGEESEEKVFEDYKKINKLISIL